MEWISSHGTFLQFMTSLGTLAVWIFYAQLLYAGFRRQRRPKVVINQVMGLSTQGRCLISNMSAEGIHIETVQVWLHEKCGIRRCTVSEVDTDENGNTPTCDGSLHEPVELLGVSTILLGHRRNSIVSAFPTELKKRYFN